jgi:hypothetical protein
MLKSIQKLAIGPEPWVKADYEKRRSKPLKRAYQAPGCITRQNNAHQNAFGNLKRSLE